MKAWITLAIVLLVVALGGGAYQHFFTAVDVDVAPADVGTMRQFVDERAKTRLPKTYRITMPFAGRLEAITLDEGQAVKQGQVVAQVVQQDRDVMLRRAKALVARLEASIKENDDASVEQVSLTQALNFVISMRETVRAAANRMTSGKEKFGYAAKKLRRVEKLFEKEAKTADDLDLAQLAEVEARVDYDQDKLVHSAMVAMQAATDLLPKLVRQYIQRKQLHRGVLIQELAEAQAALDQAETDYHRSTMIAPVDGVVLERHFDNPRVVPAGEVLMTIGRLEDLEVEAEILSQDVAQVQVGDPVEIYGPAIGPTPVSGTVARVYPAGFTKISSLGVEQQRVLVIIHFAEGEVTRLRETRSLGVDYRVRVRIITAQESDALTIPRSALFRATNGGWQVFVVHEQLAKLQPVEVGLMNDRRVEVTGGLEPGDDVVLAPDSNLTSGVRVRTNSQQEEADAPAP